MVFSATVELGGQRLSVPARQTALGPLFSLPPLAERLGGKLEAGAYGESFELKILDKKLIFGPESPALTIGERIIRLSQPPIGSVSGLMVPLDFLDEAFGVGLGYRFRWDHPTLTLSIERQESRILLVATELVHLQGATTLAFEFSEPPRYRIEEFPGLVTVEVRGDQLRSRGRIPSRDPLVRRVSIADQSIRISLEPGAATQSYVLENPFRLVFDVYQAGGTAGTETSPTRITRPQRRRGVQTIVIDPGHGGSETGAKSTTGVYEKELTLILAKALRRGLLSRLPVEVVLTREGDEELPLPARTAIANQNKADLFISLHLNSAYGAKAQGAETYILSTEASDSRAA
ncbi:MAG: N-acetylmuramoyl-L-alanine amidase, partial [Acidobacteria bacterium]|nr:N-acetylmuramoyl-L-alanine amidase [Acidobacteriota bacterium]